MEAELDDHSKREDFLKGLHIYENMRNENARGRLERGQALKVAATVSAGTTGTYHVEKVWGFLWDFETLMREENRKPEKKEIETIKFGTRVIRGVRRDKWVPGAYRVSNSTEDFITNSAVVASHDDVDPDLAAEHLSKVFKTGEKHLEIGLVKKVVKDTQ